MSLSRRILDFCWLAFDVIAGEEFLKCLPDEFFPIVVSTFCRTWVATQPVCVELDGAGLGVGSWDQGELTQIVHALSIVKIWILYLLAPLMESSWIRTVQSPVQSRRSFEKGSLSRSAGTTGKRP